jgi:hypothetical protein
MGGNPAIGFARLTQALGRKELLGDEDECEVMMETGPSPALVVIEAE